MNQKNTLFVANWKAQLTFNQALSFAHENQKDLISLASYKNIDLVLCPSFDALSCVEKLFSDSDVKIGAQDCSFYRSGAHTGEVLAESLAQLGCTYCIIGHSERRKSFNETDDSIALKIQRLFENNLTPIVCIGETKEEREKNVTQKVLQQQLSAIFDGFSSKETNSHSLCIAYEPIWAIGTGVTPKKDALELIINWLVNLCSQAIPHIQVKILYGGSVNEKNAASLTAIASLDGLLIGGASIDFQKLNKIVSLYCKDF